MKTILPFLCGLIISSTIYCQEYNQLLDSYGWCCEWYAGTGASYSEYFIFGDTMINQDLYTIINPIDWHNTYFLQENPEQKKVWYLNYNGDKELLYDFGLKLNDTFDIHIEDTIIGSYLVMDLDTITTLSGNRKSWSLYLLDSITTERGTISRDLIWIEGIGSTYGPIYPKSIPSINQSGGAGTCLEGVYSFDRVQTYLGNCNYIRGYWPGSCNFVTSKVHQIKKKPIMAYFNSLGDLKISAEGRMVQLYIYDLNGRHVYSYANKSVDKDFTIPNQLPVGIYICEMYSETNERFSVKAVKCYKSP